MTGFTYIRSLDGLRAVAVIAVVLCHLSHGFFPGGSVGVDIFFVLSGFLITSVLKAEYAAAGRISLSRFYIRRVLRLWPALWLMVAVITLVAVVTGAPTRHPGLDALATLTFTMNFVRIWSHISELSPLGHCWSLAVEDQFYLLWPFCLMVLLRLPQRWRLGLLGLMVAVIEIWKLALALHHAHPDRLTYGSDTRADQLLLGCMLSLWWSEAPSQRQQTLMGGGWVAACALLTAFVIIGPSRNSPILAAEYGLCGLASVVLIARLISGSHGVLPWLLATRPAVYIGKISYGIYLWHYAVLLLVRIHNTNRLLSLSAVAVSFLLAAASYHWVETPMLQLKRRFAGAPFPLRLRPATVPSAAIPQEFVE